MTWLDGAKVFSGSIEVRALYRLVRNKPSLSCARGTHPVGEFDRALGEALAIALPLSEAVDDEEVASSNMIRLLLVVF
jgi:hypothetical protein